MAELEVDFEKKLAEAIKEDFREHIETEIQQRHLECECGSDEFDVETWTTSSDEIMGAAVCRDCNERVRLDIDTSDLDKYT